MKKPKKCTQHELGALEYEHRTNSYILERGECVKCGKRGQFETTATKVDGKYKESRKWTTLDA